MSTFQASQPGAKRRPGGWFRFDLILRRWRDAATDFPWRPSFWNPILANIQIEVRADHLSCWTKESLTPATTWRYGRELSTSRLGAKTWGNIKTNPAHMCVSSDCAYQAKPIPDHDRAMFCDIATADTWALQLFGLSFSKSSFEHNLPQTLMVGKPHPL